jgi:hypothetical protein
MIDKEKLDLEIRLIAIEWVIVKIGMTAAIAAGLNPEHVKQIRENARKDVLKETFPGADAAMADHVGAEIADRVEDTLRRIEIQVGLAYQRRHEEESG